MINRIKTFISSIIGKLEYQIRIVSSDGTIKVLTANNIAEVDKLVIEVNNERYWQVERIDKIRRFKFTYHKQIQHRPLMFSHADVTEPYTVNGIQFSFLQKSKSLSNIIRKS
jgi:hypothetical protein